MKGTSEQHATKTFNTPNQIIISDDIQESFDDLKMEIMNKAYIFKNKIQVGWYSKYSFRS